ncbi:MAG TPA: SDR family oxidoreductase [Fimbriimonadaceae bacterium]|jgi:NAD(P)-dependent dehydrogenase (short-subunit alcohol dehydrogenase family)
MTTQKTALITGANKGIGFEIAKELGELGITVLVAARDEARGKEAVSQLSGYGVTAVYVNLDVTEQATIDAAANFIAKQFGSLDILVNNAGITGTGSFIPSEVTTETMLNVYATNVFGVVAVTNAMLPLLKKSPSGRIVNMSSGLGSITLANDPDSQYGSRNFMPYQSSKSALNAITVAYAKELREEGIKVNAADPGFTATDLNQHRGTRTVQQAAAIVVRLATLPDDGPTGSFQDEDGVIPW